MINKVKEYYEVKITYYESSENPNLVVGVHYFDDPKDVISFLKEKRFYTCYDYTEENNLKPIYQQERDTSVKAYIRHVVDHRDYLKKMLDIVEKE